MNPTLRRHFALACSSFPCPAPHHVDLAPQLLVVSLAEAALRAVDRALDGAHPILAATTLTHRPPPDLDTSEHLAILILDAAGNLAELLRSYVASVQTDIDRDQEEPDDDLF